MSRLPPALSLKTVTALAASLLATSAWADSKTDQRCGAGTCGKKTIQAGAPTSSSMDKPQPKKPRPKDADKKEADSSMSEASCSKKDAACSKK